MIVLHFCRFVKKYLALEASGPKRSDLFNIVADSLKKEGVPLLTKHEREQVCIR